MNIYSTKFEQELENLSLHASNCWLGAFQTGILSSSNYCTTTTRLLLRYYSATRLVVAE